MAAEAAISARRSREATEGISSSHQRGFCAAGLDLDLSVANRVGDILEVCLVSLSLRLVEGKHWDEAAGVDTQLSQRVEQILARP
jgi:hypothetical protein